MKKVEYAEKDLAGLDEIGALWAKLNELHASQTSPFAELYRKRKYAERKQEIAEKAEGKKLLVHLAVDPETHAPAGYCVSIAEPGKWGEVESLYIDPEYRKLGIGDVFMKRALEWMEGFAVPKKKIVVYAGNEGVIRFYQRHGFAPRYIVLEQTPKKG